MSGNKKKPPELSLIQAKADLVAAKSCLSEAEKSTVRLAKYLRGQCGYHLQQACEKMIKLQIYKALTMVDYGKSISMIWRIWNLMRDQKALCYPCPNIYLKGLH